VKANVGSPDRILRIVAGLGLLSLIFLLEGNNRWFGLIGIVPLLTAAIGWCPAYTLLGIKTCPVRSRDLA